jgi:hypothetical protein
LIPPAQNYAGFSPQKNPASNADNYILIQKVAEDTIVLLLSPIKMQSVLLHIRQICLVFHSTLLFHPWLPADISTTPGKN